MQPATSQMCWNQSWKAWNMPSSLRQKWWRASLGLDFVSNGPCLELTIFPSPAIARTFSALLVNVYYLSPKQQNLVFLYYIPTAT